jgi:hypothetical protein
LSSEYPPPWGHKLSMWGWLHYMIDVRNPEASPPCSCPNVAHFGLGNSGQWAGFTVCQRGSTAMLRGATTRLSSGEEYTLRPLDPKATVGIRFQHFKILSVRVRSDDWGISHVPLCHTRFWKANRMRTMYVPGSETHVHSDYIIRHHHTMLEINSRKVLYYIKMSKTSTESIT